MRTNLSGLCLIGLCLASLAAVGCNGGPPAGWTKAYAADLSSPATAKAWTPLAGTVKVAGGVMTIAPEEGESNAQVLLGKPTFEGDVRVELVGSLTGEEISDLSVVLGADPSGFDNGYLLQFGGGGNTESRLRVAGGLVDKTINDKALVTPGRKHRVVAMRDGGTVTLEVDGKVAFQHTDPDPLVGKAHGMIGFYTWESVLTIHKLAVYTKPAAAPAK